MCFCLATCLAWGIQLYSLLAVEWSWVLVLRWSYLGQLSLSDITWGREVSGSPMSWTRLSHLRGLDLIPSWSTNTLSATWCPVSQNSEMDFIELKSQCSQDHHHSGCSAKSTSPKNGWRWSIGPRPAITGSQRAWVYLDIKVWF